MKRAKENAVENLMVVQSSYRLPEVEKRECEAITTQSERYSSEDEHGHIERSGRTYKRKGKPSSAAATRSDKETKQLQRAGNILSLVGFILQPTLSRHPCNHGAITQGPRVPTMPQKIPTKFTWRFD